VFESDFCALAVPAAAYIDFKSSQMVKTCGTLQDVLAVQSMMCQ
jgi:hypothetical protein